MCLKPSPRQERAGTELICCPVEQPPPSLWATPSLGRGCQGLTLQGRPRGLSAACAVVVYSLSRVQLCNPVDCSTPGFPVLHYLLEFAQTHVGFWSGLPGPPPGDLPDAGIGSVSLMSSALAGGFFTTGAVWEARGAECKKKKAGCLYRGQEHGNRSIEEGDVKATRSADMKTLLVCFDVVFCITCVCVCVCVCANIVYSGKSCSWL